MAKIKQLPPALINQIAAGEVVERPASVLKELVENALDAGGTQIDIVLRHAGRELIAVTDNGCGMSPEDARMSLEAHATSKIEKFDDLLNVATMGFRGEAIPSIASVSHFRISTREKGAPEGTEIKVEGGKIVREGPCAAPEGTTVTVEHLFYNVPARRKFLKADNTEMARCVEAARMIALAHPEVGFSLKDGTRVLFELRANSSLRERIGALFPKIGANQLIEVELSEGEACFSGLVSSPAHLQPTRETIQFFVNSRPVEGKTFAIVLKEAYGEIMGPGRYPTAFLFLKLPPAEVDVNVHPAKREVRLRSERTLQSMMTRALMRALSGAAAPSSAPTLPDSPISTTANGLPSFAPARQIPPLPTVSPTSIPFAHPLPPPNFSPKAFGESQTIFKLAENPEKLPWQFIGFASDDFALFKSETGLVVVAIAPAQDRVEAQKVSMALSGGGSHSQQLLPPVLLELEGNLRASLEENLGALEAQGFALSEFGRDTYRLEAVPDYIFDATAASSPEELFLTILGKLAEGEQVATLFSPDRIGALLAGGHRVKMRYAEEAIELACALLKSAQPLKAPSGAPTIWEIPFSDLKKKFFL